MSLRTLRTKKVLITKLPQDFILKLRLIPWMHTKGGVIWLASMAVGKSTRQINDWMARRGNRRVRQMDSSLTGKFAMKPQLMAMHQVRKWIKEVPIGDSVALRCESTSPEKQFKVWKKWFAQNEDPDWVVSEKYKAFLFYREE